MSDTVCVFFARLHVITTPDPLRRYEAGQGTIVGIAGIGGLGQMGIKLAKAMGCTRALSVSHFRLQFGSRIVVCGVSAMHIYCRQSLSALVSLRVSTVLSLHSIPTLCGVVSLLAHPRRVLVLSVSMCPRLFRCHTGQVTAITRSAEKGAFALKCGADRVLLVSDAAAMAAAQSTFDLILNTIPISHDYEVWAHTNQTEEISPNLLYSVPIFFLANWAKQILSLHTSAWLL